MNIYTQHALMLLLGVLSACAQEPAAQTVRPTPAPPTLVAPPRTVVSASSSQILAAARADITKALALTCSGPKDCTTLGIGARACGGPETYLAYNPAATDLHRLREAALRYERLRKQNIVARGEMSTCEVLADPGAVCTPAGLCQSAEARRSQVGVEAR